MIFDYFRQIKLRAKEQVVCAPSENSGISAKAQYRKDEARETQRERERVKKIWNVLGITEMGSLSKLRQRAEISKWCVYVNNDLTGVFYTIFPENRMRFSNSVSHTNVKKKIHIISVPMAV